MNSDDLNALIVVYLNPAGHWDLQRQAYCERCPETLSLFPDIMVTEHDAGVYFGQLYGMSGVNRVRGTWTLEPGTGGTGGRLVVGPLVSTLMAGPDDVRTEPRLWSSSQSSTACGVLL